MPKLAAGAVALTLLAVAEVPNFFSGLLPSLWTIGHFSASENQEAVYWIRRGEVMAAGLVIVVGVATSMIAGTWIPLVGMLLMAAALIYAYEHALAHGSGATY